MKDLPDYLADRVSPEPNTGCWLWLSSLSVDGYGYTRLRGQGRKHKRAHRVVYEWFKGPIPEGLQLDHLCRVRSCVNPDHLEPVTHKENMRRSPRVSGPTCQRGHSRNDANFVRTSSGQYRCRLCWNIKVREWRQRNPGWQQKEKVDATETRKQSESNQQQHPH